MSLRLTTLSLPSMLAFAALHCLARASSLPMASFMASPPAEFVLTEPASAESDAPPHVKVFYEKSDDLANLAFDSLSLFYETESTFSTCPASAAGTPYASSIADSSIGLNVPWLAALTASSAALAAHHTSEEGPARASAATDELELQV